MSLDLFSLKVVTLLFIRTVITTSFGGGYV